jgi:hypothetical protein
VTKWATRFFCAHSAPCAFVFAFVAAASPRILQSAEALAKVEGGQIGSVLSFGSAELSKIKRYAKTGGQAAARFFLAR